ncbi:hypothetical protein C5167_034942 [Papaver somniferum]|uniref:Uncharacterized protein n=1 Tax=Papaver somniferum TaxID=3469 RepID=A0A4Y7KG35_PAPSO|nr:uncharacterized protein LOC113293511 [Papaver somniferum]RZC71817.1 hypothetical protein C5167_034942 [Papaver somniferum]
MSKAHLNFLLLGFFLILGFSEISCIPEDTRIGRKKIPVRNDCTPENGCDRTCREHNLQGPSECIVTISGLSQYTSYECECCKCVATKFVNVHICNPQICVERCVLEAGVNGPSECRDVYVGSRTYIHECYCCDDKAKLTAGNNVAVA